MSKECIGYADMAPAREIPSIDIKRIPLYDMIPPPEMRRARPELVSTAGHELNHALLALMLHAQVNRISVIPNGNILGVTEIGGNISDGSFKIIAAGGAVDPLVGSGPSGYGSDLMQVGLVDGKSGGATIFDNSVFTAGSMLNTFSPEVRRKAAEMIAYLGEVSGGLLGAIIDRAKFEVKMEKSGRFGEIIAAFKSNNPLVYKKPGIPAYSKEQKADPRSKLDVVNDNGEIIRSVVICPVCGGEVGHKIGCKGIEDDKLQSNILMNPFPPAREKSKKPFVVSISDM